MGGTGVLATRRTAPTTQAPVTSSVHTLSPAWRASTAMGPSGVKDRRPAGEAYGARRWAGRRAAADDDRPVARDRAGHVLAVATRLLARREQLIEPVGVADRRELDRPELLPELVDRKGRVGVRIGVRIEGEARRDRGPGSGTAGSRRGARPRAAPGRRERPDTRRVAVEQRPECVDERDLELWLAECRSRGWRGGRARRRGRWWGARRCGRRGRRWCRRDGGRWRGRRAAPPHAATATVSSRDTASRLMTG